MSEYQYYEFQAVERPLTRDDMAELRAISSRAKITPTRFQNFYTYGDFGGDPRQLMEEYFDAFVYVANWGTRQLMLRLPRRALDPELTRPYCVDGGVELEVTRDHVIVDLSSNDDEGGGWVEDEEAEGWLPALLPLRGELAAGDLRSLYLAWLAAAQYGPLDVDEVEPPVPAGLGQLSASLEALVEFLQLDRDLIAEAATRSGELPKGPSSADLERWIRALPESEKTDLLIRLARDEGSQPRAELLNRFRETQARAPAAFGERTAGGLLAAAEERAEARQREDVAREAAARSSYLDGLLGREEELWRQVEALIELKRALEYDQAVRLLKDLQELSARQGQGVRFAERFSALRARYARRTALLQRFEDAGLRPRVLFADSDLSGGTRRA